MNRPLTALVFIILGSVAMAEEEQDSLIALPLLEHLRVTELIEYRCQPNYRCEVSCSAGQGQQELERQNVHRMELAIREDLLVISAVYTDAVGKAHQSTAILPRPGSCVVNNLEVRAVTPLVGGSLERDVNEDEVIFDMQPDNGN